MVRFVKSLAEPGKIRGKKPINLGLGSYFGGMAAYGPSAQA
jgi:hypothetical protein